MGDENTILTAAEARHLLRRTGFGADPKTLSRLIGQTRGAAADQLLAFRVSAFKPLGQLVEDRQANWVKYMITTNIPLQEKLVLFWHDHFAASYEKVRRHDLLANQNALFRKNGKGNFKNLVKAVNFDAAMMDYLDTPLNDRLHPNENYARELQELFTLGVQDFNGNPNYAQADVVQIARAFTGCRYVSRNGKPQFEPGAHDYMADYPERGPKVIYQMTGGFGPDGRSFTVNGESTAANFRAEPDAVIDAIFDHKDTSGKSTVARFIAGKLFSYFAQPTQKRQVPAELQPVIDAIISASGFDSNWSIAGLLRAMFVDDAFYATGASRAIDPNAPKSVRWPVDFVVSTLRLLRMRPKGRFQLIPGGTNNIVPNHLLAMGQALFYPPSVFGWDWEGGWLSSGTLVGRCTFARDLTAARGFGPSNFRPQILMDLRLSDPGTIVDTVTGIFGITDQLVPAERQAFIDYLTDDGTQTALNLSDATVRNTKLHGLFALVMSSPVYQLH